MPIDPEQVKAMIEAINKKSSSEKLKLAALSSLLNDIYAADDSLTKDSNKIEFETHQKLKELYSTALDIMKGKKDFSADAIPSLADYFTEEELKSEEFKAQKSVEAPEHLWLYLFDRAPVLGPLISDQDREVLKALENVEFVPEEHSSNYRLEFSFKPNDYFTNDKLVLNVTLDSENDEVEEITSTEIAWKPGKNIRMVETQKKQKNKKSGQIRVTTKQEKTESFFWVFSHHVPVEEDYDEEEPENAEPLGEAELFYNACDVVHFFKESFFTFFIPAAYGVEVKEFADPSELGLAEGDAQDKAIKAGKGKDGEPAKPECKQQ